MKEVPLVSVFCLSYNQSQFIEESLESVKALVDCNIEIIICDDASVDNSVEIINNWIKQNPQLKIRFIAHDINKGICKSLNECLALSTGKYIQLLALDDILLSWKMNKHVTLLEASTDKQALVFSDAFLIDENSNYYQNKFIAYNKNYLSLESKNYFQELFNGNFIPAMSVLLKRSVLDDVGFFDEELSYEDYDMWLRIAQKYDFLFDKEPSACYRLHANNTHRQKNTRMALDTFKVYMKYASDVVIQEMLRNDLYNSYLNRCLIGKEKIFYTKFPPNRILDYCIIYNLPILFFKFIKLFF